jgi:hypothetical protein
VVDLSNMQLEDEQLRQLSAYLGENPLMRSMSVADNFFTDEGLCQLISALRGNSRLNHLNLRGCRGLTDRSLAALEAMVTQVNMSLYTIELDSDADAFDADLAARIQTQAALNRAI